MKIAAAQDVQTEVGFAGAVCQCLSKDRSGRPEEHLATHLEG